VPVKYRHVEYYGDIFNFVPVHIPKRPDTLLGFMTKESANFKNSGHDVLDHDHDERKCEFQKIWKSGTVDSEQ
jgi:hypothetical protein